MVTVKISIKVSPALNTNRAPNVKFVIGNFHGGVVMESLKRAVAGFYLLTIWNCLSADVVIDSNTNNELISRLYVKGGVGANITLLSTSPIGFGCHGFVLKGEADCHTPVAIKLSDGLHIDEYSCYEKLGAQSDRICEKYGIPFIYDHGEFLGLQMLAMTMLDTNLEVLRERVGPFTKDTILIIARDMVKTLKFIHSKGVIHEDVKPQNMMVKGANVFLCDFNQCDAIGSHGPRHNASKYYCSISAHMNAPAAESDDIQSLYYTLLTLADVELPWMNVTSRSEILEYKLRFKEVENLIKQVKDPGLAELYKKFYAEMDESNKQKRLPRYEYLYHMFNDALHDNRDRSKRIVFDWLTSDERAIAMMEDVRNIEDIQMPTKYSRERH